MFYNIIVSINGKSYSVLLEFKLQLISGLPVCLYALYFANGLSLYKKAQHIDAIKRYIHRNSNNEQV